MATETTSSITALTAELRTLLPGDSKVSTAASVREQHGKDESYHRPYPPDIVVFPATTGEVSDIVRVCARTKTPVIAFGAGTSLEGHVCALRGGVCVDLSGMTDVVKLNAEDMDVTVQAGVTRNQLNQYLKETGLFFPIDPGANATLGGMAATRASGTNAVRYGTMKENTIGLTVVLADGEVIRTARRARKSAAGYDLTRVFVGSEGTLGIITEVTVKLYGIPESVAAAVCGFPSIDDAVNTVILTIQSGIPIARIELLDGLEMDAVNKYSGLDYEVRPTLFLEFHGSDTGVQEQISQFESIGRDFGAGGLQWATRTEDRSKLWRARHDALYANLALRPGAKVWATDVCVPISRLAECIAETKRDMEEASFPIALVGHVGDGNFHLAMVIDPAAKHEIGEAAKLNERLIMRAIEMDGTCTGEHGIGSAKIEFLDAEHGGAMRVMRAIKRSLDPEGIMNPGKVLNMN